MNAFGKMKQWILVLAFLNLAALALCVFLFLEVKKKNERVSVLVNEISLRSKQDSAFRSVKAVVGETADLREKVNSYFVGRDGVSTFLELVESIGRESGADVSIKSVDLLASPDSTAHATLSLSVESIGAWGIQLQFLSLVELLPFEVRVDRVSFSETVEKENGFPVWVGAISFKVLKLSE